MKKICLIIALIMGFSPLDLQAQNSFKTYYKTGEVKTEGNLLNRKRHGQWKVFYKNGQISNIYNYDNGKRSEEQIAYYENGSLKQVTKAENGGFVSKRYYKNGKLEYEKPLGSGPYKEYYNTGELKVEADIKDGLLDGRWTLLQKTGGYIWLIDYKNGYRNGTYKAYHDNGNIKIKGTVKQNKKDGEEIIYYLGNIVKQKGEYEDGEMDGTWVNYDKDGYVTEEVKYRKGKAAGSANPGFELSPLPNAFSEKSPVFPNCDDSLNNRDLSDCFNEKMIEFVKSRFNKDLVTKSRSVGPQKIDLNFTVDTAGKLVDIKINASFSELIRETARIMRQLPIVEPGKYNDQPLNTDFDISIPLHEKDN